jgi:hypothetical protein
MTNEPSTDLEKNKFDIQLFPESVPGDHLYPYYILLQTNSLVDTCWHFIQTHVPIVAISRYSSSTRPRPHVGLRGTAPLPTCIHTYSKATRIEINSQS